jgi:hypothetical protein
MRNTLLILGLVTMLGCGPTDSKRPTTWEGRYTVAVKGINTATTESERFYRMQEAAKAAFETGRFEDARAHAEQALTLASRYRSDWNYGNAVHDSHMVLGRIALNRGDVATAKRELLQAGGNPDLRS